MPTELDPAWEYWDGGDPEIRELLGRAAQVAGFESLGLEYELPACRRPGDANTGFRFGWGSPDYPRLKLAREKPTNESPELPRAISCEWCGGLFIPRRPDRRFCCKQHSSLSQWSEGGARREAVKELAQRRCRTCRHPFVIRHPAQRYCKAACQVKDWPRRVKQMHRERAARVCGCTVCGGPIPEEKLKNNHTPKYCSLRCKKKRDNALHGPKARAKARAARESGGPT